MKKSEKDLSALWQQYDSVLRSILDKDAPVSTKTYSAQKISTPWMTPKIMKAKILASPQSRANMAQIDHHVVGLFQNIFYVVTPGIISLHLLSRWNGLYMQAYIDPVLPIIFYYLIEFKILCFQNWKVFP